MNRMAINFIVTLFDDCRQPYGVHFFRMILLSMFLDWLADEKPDLQLQTQFLYHKD